MGIGQITTVMTIKALVTPEMCRRIDSTNKAWL